MSKIKSLRQSLGVTQKQLATAAGVDLRWLQKVESGEINIENITVLNFSKLIDGFNALCDNDSLNDDDRTVVKSISDNVKKIIT